MCMSAVIQKMIRFSAGNLHDVNHFLKVYAYAKTIGEAEGLDRETQLRLEVAAVIHDIGCPLCRKKYGSTEARLQEAEGAVLATEFLKEFSFSPDFSERVIWLVGHHHGLAGIDGIDHQILIEADYLVNADEHPYPREHVENTLQHIFQTASGRAILQSLYLS